MSTTPNETLPRFITPHEMQVVQQPWCQCDWLCRPGLGAAENLLVVRAHMPAGKAHRFHRHPGAEEAIYILSGRAEQWVGQERRILNPGDMAHIPTDMPHSTLNASLEMLVFLAILSPATADGPATIDVYDEEPWRSITAEASST